MSDLISRQAAIDVCDNAIDLWHGQLGEGIVIAVKKKIEELPSAHPEIEERKEELISRKAAIDALEKIPVREFKKTDGLLDALVSIGQVYMALKKLPSAQPEIVHCRDCMYYGTYYRGNESKPVITHLCKLCLDRTMEPDDYCSHAERRTDEVNDIT